MKKYFIIIALFFALLLPQYATCGDFTQEDRERLIRLDVKVEEGQKALQNQIDNLQTFLLWGFGILFGGMGVLIGFVIWDMDELKYVTTRDLKDSLVKQIDDLKLFMLWGFGILFGGMGILIGFVIWDRRTALEPVARKSRELEEKEEKVVRVLKEYSRFEPKLAEILKALNL
ncbi:hypothetical protein ES703_67523 [subsurface metagenome]